MCPCHGGGVSHNHGHSPLHALSQLRKLATPVTTLAEKEYAFEVAASNLRFGEGVTAEARSLALLR
jgi:hydroxyacid-oxoacid transhydrogenase